MRKLGLLGCVLACAAVGPGAAADVGRNTPTVLLPIDESHLNPSFAAFRADLLLAIERKDKEHLLQVVSPSIKLSFGGDAGIDDFRSLWLAGPDARVNATIWEELAAVLRLGCVREGEGDRAVFTAPYVFKRFPDAYDPFEFGAVVQDGVLLRAEPNADAQIVGRLSYDIVRFVDQWLNDAPGWAHVAVPDGPEGYVPSASVRSPIDYRAFFEQIDGRWMMTIFIAGD